MNKRVVIKLRRDTAANWASEEPILSLGEPGFETDTNQFKIGNGSGVWSSLDYMRQDFVSVVSTGTIAQLSVPQQSGIKEGSLVLTDDGFRWFYKGGGSKTDETYYVKVADVSPDWAQIVSIPTSLSSIAGLTTTSGNYIYATASNTYATGVITDFGRSLIDDTNASGARTTLGLESGGSYIGSSGITLVGTLTNLETSDTTVTFIGAGSTLLKTTTSGADLTIASSGIGNVVLQGNGSGSGANIVVQGSSAGSASSVNINSSSLKCDSGRQWYCSS